MLDNKNIQKVFSLSDFRKKQLVGDVPQRTRETYREYGYFGIGVLNRIDFSNDTATALPKGIISPSRSRLAATGNSNFGWFGGGINPSPSGGWSTVSRIDYSNDISTLSIRGSLSFSREGLSATGNSNFGYFYCGYRRGPGLNIFTTTIDRIDYANDLNIASIRSNALFQSALHSSAGNSNFGYFGGGNNTGDRSSVYRLDYSNDTNTPISRGKVSVSASYLRTSVGNSNFGYFVGGAGFPASILYSTVDRINYSNDTANSSVRGPLSLAKSGMSATGNSNFGYVSGGGVPSPFLSTVDRIDYSNDTQTASVRGPLSSTQYTAAATSSSSFGGSPNSSFASDFTFPTVPNAGYFGGGTDGTNNLATIDKVDYANDTASASVRSALSVARRSLGSSGNSSFGYFAGAEIPLSSSVERLEYSSDTQNAVLRGPLSLARCLMGSTGNANFGYYGGGFLDPISTVDRIDYSTDTSTASVRGPLVRSNHNLRATGTQNFGYFGGGRLIASFYSFVDRVDYANDTTTALSRNPLSGGARFGHGATGNNSFGYFAGGGFPNTSTIDRLDYSNDTANTIIRGPLSSNKEGQAGTGNSNFGYFGGGVIISTTDRISYSSDTTAISVRGPLSSAKSRSSATSPLGYGGAPIYFTNPLPEVLQKQIEFDDSNTLDLPFKRVLGSYGYFTNGDVGGNVYITLVDRIDYSNDTATAVQRGPTVVLRVASQATGNTNYGYVSAGYPFGDARTVERIDYSNDLAITSRRGNLTQFHLYGCSLGLGNNNFGYFAGGAGPAFFSTVDRIDYSNDSATASARGPLIAARTSINGAGVGNANFGYIGGGNVPSLTPSLVSSVERIDYSNDI